MDHREKIERYSFQLLYLGYLFEHEYLTQDEYIQILKKLKSDYQVSLLDTRRRSNFVLQGGV